MRKLQNWIILAVTAICFVPMVGRSEDKFAKAPSNKGWNLKGDTATIANSDTMLLVLNRAAISGKAMTIVSDATHISLSTDGLTNTNSHVVLSVPGGGKTPNSDGEGVTCTMTLVCGSDPSLSFNGKDVKQRDLILWQNLEQVADKTVKLELVNATFAKVTFPPSEERAPTTAPVSVATTRRETGGIELLHNVKASKLSASAKTFSDSVSRKCLNCGGTGKVTVSVQIGTQKQGAFQVPVMQDQVQQCSKCAGSGLLHDKDDVVLRNGAQMVRNLICLDTTDSQAQDALKSTYTIVTQTMLKDRNCWNNFTKDAKSTLAMAHPKVGTAIVTEVKVTKAESDSQGHRMITVEIPHTTNRFLVVDPPSADNVVGGFVLVGGLIQPAGSVEGAGGLTILQGAFMIAPDSEMRPLWWVTQ